MPDILARFLADPALSTIITAAVAGLVALWLLSALWVHGDAEHRTGSELAALVAAGWVLLSTPLLLPLSLAVYAAVRPQEPLAERRSRAITAAMIADSLVAASCGTCGSLVDPAWRRCPTCASWVAAPCAACGRWSDADLDACPWCGEGERDQPTVGEPQGLPTAWPLVAAAAVQGAVLEGAGRARVGARQATGTRERALGVTAGRHRSLRPWQRRAPGGARSTERGGAGGRSGARSRT
ncbi:MAG: zinc ribbon domain-containing protein [Chloroflexi bacterium]|nr:zinc ribbon domain-containing protein [Chloroflexota bacterium]